MSMGAPAIGKLSIALHWTVALGIVGMIGFGIAIGAMERGPGKTAMIQVHKSIGVVVGALALVRLIWRVREGFPAPIARRAWEALVSRHVHVWLLLLTIAMPITGMLKSVTYARPVDVFGLPLLPQLMAEKDVALNEMVSLAHATLGYLLAALIVLHAGAALKHHFVDRDATLRRMLRPAARLGT